jgi:FMN hydrolase / 5-amino-6-(5-phospho-D-ribitylamino)uracil phosphatase
MLATLKVLSFDLDNTLWDTPPVLQAAEQALESWLASHAPALARRYTAVGFAERRAGLLRERPELLHDVSAIRQHILADCAREADLPPAQAHALAETAFAVFLAARQQVQLYPEVAACLTWAQRHFRLAAITNGNACVYRAGLGQWFCTAIDPRVAGVAKPHPRIFTLLCERLAVSPAQVLHIGDDPDADVRGAMGVGMRTVWVNRAGLAWPNDLTPPEWEVRDLAQLRTCLTALAG